MSFGTSNSISKGASEAFRYVVEDVVNFRTRVHGEFATTSLTPDLGASLIVGLMLKEEVEWAKRFKLDQVDLSRCIFHSPAL